VDGWNGYLGYPFAKLTTWSFTTFLFFFGKRYPIMEVTGKFVSSSEAVPRNSEKAPAASVTISTLSEVFLQNHGIIKLQDHRLNDKRSSIPSQAT
jgi:hypothetical protein